MKTLVKNITKLSLAGATICGIAFYFVTTAPTADAPLAVNEVEADVAWFDVASDGHEFTRAMAAAGLEPRPYDLNGNVIYFANGKVDKTPAEVESALQKILVEHRVNSKSYAGAQTNESLAARGKLRTEDDVAKLGEKLGGNELSEAMLAGEVVPTSRTKDYVAMSGIDYGMSKDEMMAAIEAGDIKDLSDLEPQGYNFIEATYEPETGMTDLQAVWTAKEFDAKKMNNTAFKQQEPDPNVPSCMGCERQVRFQSLSKDEPMRANRWNTQTTVDQTFKFYATAMANRGWKESGAQMKLNRLHDAGVMLGVDGKILNLEQDGKTMQIVMIPDGVGGTLVMSHETYKGAESTF